jgi:23S rRNA pseudouridine2605 synthase
MGGRRRGGRRRGGGEPRGGRGADNDRQRRDPAGPGGAGESNGEPAAKAPHPEAAHPDEKNPDEGRLAEKRAADQRPDLRGGGRDDESEDEPRERPRRAPMHLSVFLARAGMGSRRRTDELVQQGHVTVNGAVEAFPRREIGPDDEVTVDGEPAEPKELRYVLVNKPRGVASTRSDPHADRLLVDLVPNGRILFPVGRLDVETTGLIILTNDGVLANRLMHPRYGVPKTYTARVQGRVSKRALQALRTGVDLEDGLTAPAEARLVRQSPKTALVELTLHEGRKRQVRRMLAALELPVDELHRRRYGPLSDKGLNVGAYRDLTAEEVEALRRAGEESDRRLRAVDPDDELGPETVVEP